MVGADVGGVVKPEPRHLGQHLALEGDRRQNPVKGRDPVGRDQDAPRRLILRRGQIVTIPHLAEIGIGQFVNAGMVKNTGKIGHAGGPPLSDRAIARGRRDVNSRDRSLAAPALSSWLKYPRRRHPSAVKGASGGDILAKMKALRLNSTNLAWLGQTSRGRAGRGSPAPAGLRPAPRRRFSRRCRGVRPALRRSGR